MILNRICFRLLWLVMLPLFATGAFARETYNFNSDWLLFIGDVPEAMQSAYADSQWRSVTLPYAFNGHEAFQRDIVDLTDTVVWYRKHFYFDNLRGKKVFIEFEGVRQGADFYMNGHPLGFSENGVMACGFDLTPYLVEGENVIAVRCDNSWTYRSRKHNSRYQWNDRNFNANYGGIPKNVWLHITPLLYQTLPLYSDLGTTGTYVYATDFDIPGHTARIHTESQVRNESTKLQSFALQVCIRDAQGKEVAQFRGDKLTVPPGTTVTAKAEATVRDLHFWSWGYGYLYHVETTLSDIDPVSIRTGFRKTRFGEGKIWVNDRVMMVHGYAQRTSNEWPGVGLSVPAWLSDYSNGLMVESNGNLVRWMHVTPWKQDVESCDRVGLMQAMPAGDSERDVEGPRWAQRIEVMRDAIIYNRNNPSIIFYECGNESVSRAHMLEMKAIRDTFDPYGGRAIGSREMLDIDEAEYGGEMLYINKSGKHPMWAMEYCRDEGLRKYWDAYSYPFHPEGAGPLYRGKPAREYNHNMDEMAIEMVRRWYDYWLERPGTGTRVSSGGVKIVFSDTNTHHRGEANYRSSGVTDAMRLPKDAFYAHQVMWNGWVKPEAPKTHIIGHWNYPEHTVKPVYVISTADDVELFLNGTSLGHGTRSYNFLFTFDKVAFMPGMLEAVASDGSRHSLRTASSPYRLQISLLSNPDGPMADGADMVLATVEVVDSLGQRCPLDNRQIRFSLQGEAEWIGGIAVRDSVCTTTHKPSSRDVDLLDAAATQSLSDNYVGQRQLPVECGVNRILLRTTCHGGDVLLKAEAEGLLSDSLSFTTSEITTTKGLSTYIPSQTLPCRLDKGETPLSPSYTDEYLTLPIVSATSGFDTEHVRRSFDDNELSEWRNDGRLSTAWISYRLGTPSTVHRVCMKLTGWRMRSYPLEILADGKLIWQGETPRSLGYIHLDVTPTLASEITLRLCGTGTDDDAFSGIVEVAEPAAGELDLYKSSRGSERGNELRIVEVDFLQQVR